MASSVALPKASEAREAYEQGKNLLVSEDWNNAAREILSAQKGNKTFVHLGWPINEATKAELERLGYLVSYGKQYNDLYTNVQW